MCVLEMWVQTEQKPGDSGLCFFFIASVSSFPFFMWQTMKALLTAGGFLCLARTSRQAGISYVSYCTV